MQVLIAALVLQLLTVVFAILQVLPDENIYDCTKNGKSKYINWTGLYYEAINDTLFYLNGI